MQALDWPDDFFWKPDGHGPSGPDIFRREFGFPHHPGLLERGAARVPRRGPAHPLALLLRQPRGAQPGRRGGHHRDRRRTGRRPASRWRCRTTFDHDQALELFTAPPGGVPGRAVARRHRRPGPAADHPARLRRRPLPARCPPGRARLHRAEPARRHRVLRARHPGRPPDRAGHQLPGRRRRRAAWTGSRPAGWRRGWPRCTRPTAGPMAIRSAPATTTVWPSCSPTMGSTRSPIPAHTGPGGEPLFSGADLLALLHRFPNVVLWLNGHTHTNAVRPRRDPADPARGFWEVTTCAIVDWPCQTRLVELVDAGEHLSIVCTMADHDSPLGPASLETGADLAALHRELAANVPFGGAGSGLAGATLDRNVELRLRPPFPLGRLASGTAGRFAAQAGRAARAGGESLVEWPGAVARPELPGERPVGGPAPGLRLRLVPRPAAGDHRARHRRRRRAGADADRRRQVAVLPDPGAGAPGHGRGHLAADRADAGPGRRAAGARRAGRLPQLDAGSRRSAAAVERAFARRASSTCSTWRRSGCGPSPPCACSTAARSRCSPSTRRTACRSGATTSGPTTWPCPRCTSAGPAVPRIALTATATAATRDRDRAPG